MMRFVSAKLLRYIPSLDTILSSSATMSAARRIAVCQMTSVGNKAENLKVVSNLIRDAAKDKAQMVFFPEACDYIFNNNKDTISNAEPILGGNTVNTYRELAKTHNVWLSMGGVHEKNETNTTKAYNTHIIIDNTGSIVQAYRKLHLFDVAIPDKNVRLKESDFAMAGCHIVTPVDSPVGRIGLEICYDLRFPELSTQLAMMGADILTYPSAFTHSTGEAHWELLLRARAVENQCYVIAAAQVGQHNAKRRSYGRAMCVDPWGDVLADCGTDASPCYRLVDLSADRLAAVRRNMPVFQNRRKDVYSLYALSLRDTRLPAHEATQPTAPTVPTDPTDPTDRPARQGRVFGHVTVPETCVFYATELTYAFVNLRCVIPGHVLVAPSRLVARNQDLTEDEAADFYRTVRLVQQLMEQVHSASSCTVTIQDGVDAGQTVRHLHCHVMPRKCGDFLQNDLIYLELAKNDQIRAGHPAKPARSLQEMEKEAGFLREKMKKLIDEVKKG